MSALVEEVFRNAGDGDTIGVLADAVGLATDREYMIVRDGEVIETGIRFEQFVHFSTTGIARAFGGQFGAGMDATNVRVGDEIVEVTR